MRGISLLLTLLLLLSFSGCGKKKSAGAHTAEVNTTKTKSVQQTVVSPRTFLLKDIDGRELNLTIDGKKLRSDDIYQPLLLINFFATWCPPCRGELPDLSKLQRKHAAELFIVGVLVNDEQNSTELRHFMEKHGANYYISCAETNNDLVTRLIGELKLPENFPIPLSILYRDGKFYRYYEGAMPMEMIENELEQALREKDRKRKD